MIVLGPRIAPFVAEATAFGDPGLLWLGGQRRLGGDTLGGLLVLCGGLTRGDFGHHPRRSGRCGHHGGSFGLHGGSWLSGGLVPVFYLVARPVVLGLNTYGLSAHRRAENYSR